MNNYVIIGNGVAAVSCVEGIRQADPSGKIVIISREKHAVYSRPLISYLLQGKTDVERMSYRDGDFYEKNGCEVLYGRNAVDIDTEKKSVLLDDGTVLPYTRLCAATGSTPFIPPFEGIETVENKFTFLTLDDALALNTAVNKNTRVLIAGAGLIGLKCAEGICARVKQVTVFELADRILPAVLDSSCAAVMQRHLEANGIHFMLGDTAVRFEKNTAYMKSGISQEFDLLILAVGVRPETALIKNAGGEVNRGITVNERMETGLPDIYAAGDCTEGIDTSTGSHRVLAILPNACMQGYTAGVNMAGGDSVFNKAIPMNSVGFFGLHAMSAGVCEGEMSEEITDSSLRRLYTANGFLNGFILMGDTSRAGIYTSLIREKINLNTVNFDILKKYATTFTFSPEMRGKMFGGVV